MATIIMSADKVIEAAKIVIKHIEEERKAIDERTIAHVMKKRCISWRGFYTMTREQAIHYINNEGGWDYTWSRYAWGDLDHARNLLRLAQHGDPVTLNENDIRVLF